MILRFFKKEAIERFHDLLSPGFYGRLFVVPKSTGGWRLVLDLSPLNVFLKKCPFRMDTLVSVRDAVRVGDWATSIDLSDAYFLGMDFDTISFSVRPSLPRVHKLQALLSCLHK